MYSSVILYLSFEIDSLTEPGTHRQHTLGILLPLPAGIGITGMCCSADLVLGLQTWVFMLGQQVHSH